MGFGGNSGQVANSVNTQLNQNEAAYNAWLKSIQDMVGGSGYDFFAPRTTTGSSRSVSKVNQLVSPEVLPAYQGLVNMVKGAVTNRLARPSALPPGYAERATTAINKSYEGATQAARNLAARRGLSGEQTFGAAMPIESDRAGKIADFIANLPLTERNLQNEDIGLGEALAQAFGLAHRTTGTTTTTGTSSQTMPADIGTLLQYLGLTKPYDRPVVVPGQQQGWGGPAIEGGSTIIAALIM